MLVCFCYVGLLFFFFFQAEDGIRDIGVTGVQTCALPISMLRDTDAAGVAVVERSGFLVLRIALVRHPLAGAGQQIIDRSVLIVPRDVVDLVPAVDLHARDRLEDRQDAIEDDIGAGLGIEDLPIFRAPLLAGPEVVHLLGFDAPGGRMCSIGAKPSLQDIKQPLLDILKGWFRADATHSAAWRVEAKEMYDFRAGEQWSAEDRQILNAQSRPDIVFNRVLTILKAVAGMEINGRHEVHYIPRHNQNTAVNDLLTGAGKWM